jgi:hypothetical protein
MANTPIVEVDTAYSVLQPMFEKVLRAIRSSTTAEQYYASERYVDNFLSYIETEPHLGFFPTGYCRTILSAYYGAELRKEFDNHALNQED